MLNTVDDKYNFTKNNFIYETHRQPAMNCCEVTSCVNSMTIGSWLPAMNVLIDSAVMSLVRSARPSSNYKRHSQTTAEASRNTRLTLRAANSSLKAVTTIWAAHYRTHATATEMSTVRVRYQLIPIAHIAAMITFV